MNTLFASVSSVPATHFTQALAASGAGPAPPFASTPINNIPGIPPALARRFLIRAVSVVALQNFGPELNFWSSAAVPSTTDPTADTFLGRVRFLSVTGEQQAGAGLFRYYNDTISIPYFDLDWVKAANAGGPNAGVNPPTLHVSMANVDVTGKSAAGAGLVAVTFWLQPMQGY